MNIVIIGNSAAGLSALQAFRKHDSESSVVIISKEGFLPYSRVLLPYVLRGKLSYENMTIRNEAYFKEHNASCVIGEVTSINTQNREVILEDGSAYPYDKVLIATGSYAVMPPIPGLKDERICNMWTKTDVDKLLPCFEKFKRVAVIGSGFVALQAAWAARFRGLEVTVIELMDRIMPNVLDEKGAQILTQKIKEKGVTLNTRTQTERIEKLPDGSFKIILKDKEPVLADFIIVGTGVRPNVSFLEGSDIVVDRGIPVNSYMQTNLPEVYAVGDVAAGPTFFGDEHMIHALWPTAVEMGKIAGVNMAGEHMEYQGSLNMNVTQMYDVTVASMGKFSDADIDKACYFDEREEKGYLKVCYKDNLLVGACLVGSSDAVELFGKLRPLILKKQPVDCSIQNLEQYVNIKAFAARK